jgi:hypothetical protein
MRWDGSGASYALKWNTSGNLEFYLDSVLITTISISTSRRHLSPSINNVAGNARHGGNTHRVVVWDDAVAMSCSRPPAGLRGGAPSPFGENAAAGSNTLKWYCQPVWSSYCDFTNPVPKMTSRMDVRHRHDRAGP